MVDLRPDILACIGQTPMLPLRRIVPAAARRILLKLESAEPDRQHEGPHGAGDDRGGRGRWAAAAGRRGGRVHRRQHRRVAGSGVRRQGHPLHIVTSDAFAKEKLDHMRLLGAQLQVVPSDGGRMTETLTRDMVEAARVRAEETGAFWTDQLKNVDQLAAYHGMADEIWQQSGGRVDALVQSVGTAARCAVTPKRCGDATRRSRSSRWSRTSPPCSRAAPRARTGSTASAPASWSRCGGTGSPIGSSGFRPTMRWRWRFRLAREEGLFAGTSTGANVIAALRVADGSARRHRRHRRVRHRHEVPSRPLARRRVERRSPLLIANCRSAIHFAIGDCCSVAFLIAPLAHCVIATTECVDGPIAQSPDQSPDWQSSIGNGQASTLRTARADQEPDGALDGVVELAVVRRREVGLHVALAAGIEGVVHLDAGGEAVLLEANRPRDR